MYTATERPIEMFMTITIIIGWTSEECCLVWSQERQRRAVVGLSIRVKGGGIDHDEVGGRMAVADDDADADVPNELD